MPNATTYTILTSSDLATANTIAAVLVALTLGTIACAIASLRRPKATRGRKTIAAMLFALGISEAIVAMIFLAEAAGIRQSRAQLEDGHFTELRGIVNATREVPFTRRSSPAFLLNQHWFFVPDPMIGACAPRKGEEITVDYIPADLTHLADTILSIRTAHPCP